MSPGAAVPTPLALRGELTILDAAATRAVLLSTLDAAAAAGTDVHLDLSEVEELDTAGLQLLLAAVRDGETVGVRVVVVAGSPAVREVLSLVHLDEDLRPVPGAVAA